MRLLKIHKNELFTEILDQHLNPLSFAYSEERNHIKITINDSRFYFLFTSNKFSIFPFKNLYNSYEYLTNHHKFDEYFYQLRIFFRDWLKLVKSDVITEDKWETFITQSTELKFGENIRLKDSNLGYKEVQELNRKIIVAKNEIEKIELHKELLLAVFERLNYLGNSAKVIEAREDWSNLAKGVIITLLYQLNSQLNRETINHIMAIFKSTFDSYFDFSI
jgi:hypothetical protein